jgi:hypothetical protein
MWITRRQDAAFVAPDDVDPDDDDPDDEPDPADPDPDEDELDDVDAADVVAVDDELSPDFDSPLALAAAAFFLPSPSALLSLR